MKYLLFAYLWLQWPGTSISFAILVPWITYKPIYVIIWTDFLGGFVCNNWAFLRQTSISWWDVTDHLYVVWPLVCMLWLELQRDVCLFILPLIFSLGHACLIGRYLSTLDIAHKLPHCAVALFHYGLYLMRVTLYSSCTRPVSTPALIVVSNQRGLFKLALIGQHEF